MQSTIEIATPSDLERKIAKIKKAGTSSLHLVFDFDRTLTVDGVTTFELLAESDVLSPEYAEETARLYTHYRPIELSDISLDERTEQITDYFSKISFKLSKK